MAENRRSEFVRNDGVTLEVYRRCRSCIGRPTLLWEGWRRGGSVGLVAGLGQVHRRSLIPESALYYPH